MKTLKNILLAGTLALSALAGGCVSAPIKAGYAANLKYSSSSTIEVPGRCVPEYPDSKYRTHSYWPFPIELEARLQLTPILEIGVDMASLIKSKDFSMHYETYWGGYGVGNYACIGAVSSSNKPLAYDITLQTPMINTQGGEGFRFYTSFIQKKSEINYQSGYHKFNVPFEETYDKFKVADVDSRAIRFGFSKVNKRIFDETNVNFFIQRDSLNMNLTKKARDFHYEKNPLMLGIGFRRLF